MKINDVIIKEDLDDVRGWIYRKTGLGGQGGLTAATRTKFINDFINQYNLTKKSADKGGMPFSMEDYINSYMKKYKWYANPTQMEKLKTITDPKQLANAMYAVGMQQSRDDKGYIDDPRTTGPSQGDSAPAQNPAQSQNTAQQGATGQPTYTQPTGNLPSTNTLMPSNMKPGLQVTYNKKPEDQTIDPASQQVINNVKKMKGPKFERELEQIIKLAMWNLYGTDRQDYNELVKSIMNKSTTKNPAQQQKQAPDEQGRVEPTM